MLLHKGLTQIHTQIKYRLLFGTSFTSKVLFYLNSQRLVCLKDYTKNCYMVLHKTCMKDGSQPRNDPIEDRSRISFPPLQERNKN